MCHHYLKLNGDKTELLVISTPSLSSRRINSIPILDTPAVARASVRNLGVMFDDKLNMHEHITTVCKRAFYQISLIKKIRKNLTEDIARTLVQSQVMSLLDYCNCLLYGLPASSIERLQRVQNCAARVVKCADHRSHITPILKALHWLPVRFRIMYKLNLITFKALNGAAPDYIVELVSLYQPSRTLRSSDQHLLKTPRFNLKTFGARRFAVGAPLLWNALPLALRIETDFKRFKTNLKTFYFKQAFSC
jgi:hypothetical protein